MLINSLQGHMNESESNNFNVEQLPLMKFGVNDNGYKEFMVSSPILIDREDSCNIIPKLDGIIINSSNVVIRNVQIQYLDIYPNIDVKIENCIFTMPQGTKKHSIKVGQHSSVSIRNCTFHSLPQCGIIVYNSGKCVIEGCLFENIEQTAVMILDSCSLELHNSRFNNIKRSSVFLGKYSSSKISLCYFSGMGTRTVLIGPDAFCVIDDTSFENLNHHAIYSCSRGRLQGNKLAFTNVGLAGIYATNHSTGVISHCSFLNMPGNSFLIDSSDYKISDCQIFHQNGPVITLLGQCSKLLFTGSKIRHCNTHAFILRDTSSPIIKHMSISKINGNCFSISNFCRPIIQHNVLNTINGVVFSCFNASIPLISHNRILNSPTVVDSFTYSNPIFISNIISFHEDIPNFIRIHHHGKGDFADNILLTLQQSQHFFLINETLIFQNEMTDDKYSLIPSKQECINKHQIISSFEWKTFVDHQMESVQPYSNLTCLICRKNIADTIISPCGHRVICQDCSSICHECPLCQMPYSSSVCFPSTNFSPRDICTKCNHNTIDCVNLPCGHFTTCYSCQNQSTIATRICTLCKKKTINSPPIFPL